MPARTSKDYRSDLKSVWCPGCGHFGVLAALQLAFVELDLPPDQIAVISGIGCSSRLPGYLSTYGFNTLHGRGLPIAQGAKLARPESTVVAVGGDGDTLAIGAGHFPHAIHRNVDLAFLLMDNRVYGLTKGQTSPTTPKGKKTTTARTGNTVEPMNPVRFALSAGAGFVARGFSSDTKALAKLIVEAVRYPGFALIHTISPCVTYEGIDTFDLFKGLVRPIPPSHDPTDFDQAWKLSNVEDYVPLGILFRKPAEAPQAAAKAPPPQLDRLLDRFAP